MKMGFIFSGVFWGLLLVLLGIIVIINVVFGIKIPIFRIFLGLLLIYWGLRLLTGISFCHKSRNAALFEEKKIESVSPSDKYDIVFGKRVIDLSNVVLNDEIFKVEVNTVFGSSIVKINPQVPTKIVAESFFGSATLPDGNSVTFGEYTYKSDSLKDNKNYLLINIAVIFGSTHIITK